MNDSKLLQIELELNNIDIGLQGVSVLSNLPSGRNEHKDILVGHMYDVLAIDEGNRVLTGEGIGKAIKDTIDAIIKLIKDAIESIAKWFKKFWKWLSGKKKSGGGGGGSSSLKDAKAKLKNDIKEANTKEKKRSRDIEIAGKIESLKEKTLKTASEGDKLSDKTWVEIEEMTKSPDKIDNITVSVEVPELIIKRLQNSKPLLTSVSTSSEFNKWVDNVCNVYDEILGEYFDTIEHNSTLSKKLALRDYTNGEEVDPVSTFIEIDELKTSFKIKRVHFDGNSPRYLNVKVVETSEKWKKLCDKVRKDISNVMRVIEDSNKTLGKRRDMDENKRGVTEKHINRMLALQRANERELVSIMHGLKSLAQIEDTVTKKIDTYYGRIAIIMTGITK